MSICSRNPSGDLRPAASSTTGTVRRACCRFYATRGDSRLTRRDITDGRVRVAYNRCAMNLEQKLEELKKRDHLAEAGGGEKRREKQHKEGKMSARERIEFLLDEGTFEETDKLVTHRCTDFGMER